MADSSSASVSSLQNSAGRSVPSATRAAPVSVAQSTIIVGFSEAPSNRASHRISRPSASVLPISTVMPLRVGTTSSGRKALPDTLFSTAGTSRRRRTGSLVAITMAATAIMVAAPAHVLLHVEHAGRRLEVEAAGVEAHALADQRDLGIALLAPHEIDQPRRAAAGAADGMHHGIVLLQEIVAHDHA